MAINYLNSIDLNRNELQNAQLIKAQVENQPNDASAGTGLEGQLYYDTTLDVLKVWSTGSWSEVGGGVISLTAGTYLTNSGTASDPVINHDLTTRTNGSTAETLTYGGTFTAYTDVTTNATGHVTDIEETVFTMPASDNTNTTYDLATTASGTAIALIGSDTTTDSVTISGTASEVEVTRIGASELRVGLPTNVVIAGELEVVDNLLVTGDAQFDGNAFDIASGAAIDVGNNKITEVADPTNPQDAATKQYVDDSVAGGLIYQGGYNAATNTPNLDSNPSPNLIKQGWTYTVTADGLFFTEQVRVGDVLIAEQDAPTALADWTTAQNNVDLADLTTVGIGNVNAGTGISVAYSSGTATVSLTATAARSGSIAVPTSTTYTYPNSITSSAGTNSVMIQLVDSNGDTVHADVNRVNATTFSVDYGVAEPTGVIALIQLIG